MILLFLCNILRTPTLYCTGKASWVSGDNLGLDYPPTKNGVSKCQKLIKDISKMPLEMKKNLLDGPRSIFPRSRETISNTVYRQLAQLLLVMEQTNFACPDLHRGVRCGELSSPCHRPNSIIILSVVVMTFSNDGTASRLSKTHFQYILLA